MIQLQLVIGYDAAPAQVYNLPPTAHGSKSHQALKNQTNLPPQLSPPMESTILFAMDPSLELVWFGIGGGLRVIQCEETVLRISKFMEFIIDLISEVCLIS